MSTEFYKKIYVLLVSGEVAYETTDKADALGEAEMSLTQRIYDFHRHDLPYQMTDELRQEYDIELHELGDSSRVTLPFQEWTDTVYREMQDSTKAKEDREYLRYLELHAKFKDRRLSEEAAEGEKG